MRTNPGDPARAVALGLATHALFDPRPAGEACRGIGRELKDPPCPAPTEEQRLDLDKATP